MPKHFKIAVGGHSCRLNTDADLFLDKHSDHVDNQQIRSRTLLDPSEQELAAAMDRIPDSSEVTVHTSLQGIYSLTTAPLVLQCLRGRPVRTTLFVEPIPENIRRNIGSTPAIRLSGVSPQDTSYDVALSYATEDSEEAELLASALTEASLRVFFDRFEASDLWGKDLYQYLHEIYSRQARFCIVLISANYVAQHKRWTRHELRAAQERQLESLKEYILPLRLDDSELPGLPATMGYLDLRKSSVAEVVDALREKLQRVYDWA